PARGMKVAKDPPGSCFFELRCRRCVQTREGAMKIRPLSDRIVVRREESAEVTAGGIVLPDSAKSKPQRGKVLAAGPGRLLKDGTRRSLQVKEGDTVLFTAWAGDEFKDKNSQVILLMHEEDVMAVVDQ